MPADDPHYEYPPLLESGLHEQTLGELWELCVERFTERSTRFLLMRRLQQVVHALEDEHIPAEIWVDGSFLTQKPEPNDVDIVVFFPAEILDSGPRSQRDILKWIGSNLKEELLVDSYVSEVFPISNSRFRQTEWNLRYWKNQFGRDRRQRPKGIVVLRTGR